MDIPPFLHKPIDSWINQYIADIAYTRIILFQYVPTVRTPSPLVSKPQGQALRFHVRDKDSAESLRAAMAGWCSCGGSVATNWVSDRKCYRLTPLTDHIFGFFTIRKRVKELQKMAFCHQKPIKRCFIHTTCVSIPTQVWVLPSKCVDIFSCKDMEFT